MSVAERPASLLGNPGFVRLALARIVSVLGNGFARVALAFAVLSLPGATAGELSLVVACQAVPQLALVLVGGVVADRVSRSWLMAVSDVVGAVSYGGLAVLVLSGHAPLAALCVLAVAAGTASALFGPAMDGVIPQLVAADVLQRANGLLRVGTNTSLLLGLALSGVTVAWVGAGWALAINGLSFVVSAFLTSSLRLGRRPWKASSGWRDLREGWREFASRQWLWVVVVQFSLVVAAMNANAGVLGPLAARAHFGGARAWSLVVAAQALGSVAGAGIGARTRVSRPILAAVLFTLPTAAPLALLGAGAPVWGVAAGAFAAGISLDFFGVLWATTIQREVPEEALSRVSSYDWFGSLALAPLGLALAGPAADTFGTDHMLLLFAGVIIIASLAALASPSVRNLRAPTLTCRRPLEPEPQPLRHPWRPRHPCLRQTQTTPPPPERNTGTSLRCNPQPSDNDTLLVGRTGTYSPVGAPQPPAHGSDSAEDCTPNDVRPHLRPEHHHHHERAASAEHDRLCTLWPARDDEPDSVHVEQPSRPPPNLPKARISARHDNPGRAQVSHDRFRSAGSSGRCDHALMQQRGGFA